MFDEPCASNEDCMNFPFEMCGTESKCIHKDVFPVYPIEFGGLIIVSVLMAMSTIAGIGGGGLVTPMCMTFFIFNTKSAISISGFSILTCSITRYFISTK